MRITKVTTKTGDDGTTGLGDGSRIAKNAARVEALGTVDEANSAIGVILASTSSTDFISCNIAISGIVSLNQSNKAGSRALMPFILKVAIFI